MDMTTLIIILAIVALVMFFLNRNRMMSRGPTTYGDPYTRGNERPTYNDPDYTSSGSIGGSPEVQVPEERSVGGVTTGTRHDDPKYRSGGSIGG